MKKPKILKSAKGREFAIVSICKPAENGVAFVSREEWEYIRELKLNSEEFDLVLQFKLEDHTHQIIPDDAREQRKSIAVQYAEAIKEMLRTGKKPETKTSTPIAAGTGWEKRVAQD